MPADIKVALQLWTRNAETSSGENPDLPMKDAVSSLMSWRMCAESAGPSGGEAPKTEREEPTLFPKWSSLDQPAP